MAAVGLRFRAELTRRWRAWLGLAAMIGLVAGAVLALADGARRTDSAYRRFLRAERAYDVLVLKDAASSTASSTDVAPPGPPLDPAAIGKLPGVTEVATAKYFFAFIGSGVGVVVPPDGGLGNALNRFKVLEGRRPDPANPAEVVVGFAFAEQYRVDVGDRIPLFETALFDSAPPDTPPEVLEAAEAKARILAVLPGGQAKVVGIEAAPGEFPPQIEGTNRFLIHASPALTAVVPDLIGFTGGDAVAVRLADPDRGVDRFLSALRGSAQNAASAAGLNIQRDLTGNVDRSVHTQAIALWLLALLTAVAGALVGSQLLARLTYVESDDQPVLAALGMVRRGRLVLGLARAAAIGVAAAAVAVVLAAVASPLFPTGLAGKAEPSAGFRLDGGVLPFGGLGVVIVVVALSLWPASVAARRTLGSVVAETEPLRPSMVGRALAHLRFPLSIELGVRMALEPGKGRSSVPVRSTLTAMTLGIASFGAALVFATSLGHLLATPRLYGQSWDAELTTYDDQVLATQGVPLLQADPRVDGLAVGNVRDRFTIRGRRVDGLAIDSVKGGLAPTILEGHGPEADDQIVVGTGTLRDLGLRIGDRVDVGVYIGAGFFRASGDASGHASMRVVGRAVFPVFGDAGQLGDGVYVTQTGGVRIAGEGGSYPSALVRLKPGAELDEVTGDLEAKLGLVAVIRQGKPTDIVNFGQVKQTPNLLGALLGAMSAGTLVQLLVTASRRRRRDLAVLRALGFVRRQVGAAVTWQALTLVGVALVVGLPVGIAAGLSLWRWFADSLGVVTETELRPAVFLLIAVGGLLAAFVLAALPARAAARTPTAITLRSE